MSNPHNSGSAAHNRLDYYQLSTADRQGNLLHNTILFGRILRGLGIEINPGRMIEVMQAFEHVQLGRKSDFYYTLRSLLVNRQQDLEMFDEAFERFWKAPGEEGIDINFNDLIRPQQQQEQEETLMAPPPLEDRDDPADDDDKEEDDEDTQEIIELTRTYSAREILAQKDFAELTAEEVTQIKRLMRELIWRLGERKTRRMKPGRGKDLDIRRSLRRNFRYGGEFLEWSYREQKIKPRPLVVLADISGSMERYTRLLIHFLYSLAEGMEQRVEMFTFGTRLTRITRQLKNKDIDRAIDDVSASVLDWSGGTRIGDVLRDFNFNWRRRIMRSDAIVIIISDGWDRGDPELLNQEIARLHRLCHRLVWLNPLLGSDQYEPLTRGMQAALPHIDDFLPVHNLASLEDLAIHLRGLDEKRATRRKPLQLKGAAFIKKNL